MKKAQILKKFKVAISNYYWLLLIILLAIGYVYFLQSYSEQLFSYLDNGTVATVTAVLLGLITWFVKHNKELEDKYFAEYLGLISKYFAIKQKEIDLRKGKNRRWWKFAEKDCEKGKVDLDENSLNQDSIYQRISNNLENLDLDRIEIDGEIQTRVSLLKEYKSAGVKKIEKLRTEFGHEFKEFTEHNVADEYNPKKTTPIDEYQAHVDCISSKLKKARHSFFKTIKSNN